MPHKAAEETTRRARITEAENALRAERLQTLGRLTGGVAHDFNNLLSVMMLNLEETILELPSDHPTQAWLGAALLATTRGAELTSRLLDYAGRTRVKPQQINLSETFVELSTLLNRTLGEQFVLTLDPGPSSDRAYADPCQLENALMNLVINARDAMPNGGAIAITASCHDITAPKNDVESELQPGRYVVIAVTDQGIGIPAENFGRVFEPFFTTKPPTCGNGLGLSMVYDFARQSGGHVGMTSTLGRGTTVSIYLPVGAQGGFEHVHPTSASAWTAGGLRALVVEDQPAVLDAVTRMMRQVGFEVTPTANAAAALSKLAADGGFDLLVSDIVLPPPMGGAELAIAARELAPRLRVLLTSGCPKDILDGLGGAECNAFLAKPYTRDTLRGILSHLFKDA